MSRPCSHVSEKKRGKHGHFLESMTDILNTVAKIRKSVLSLTGQPLEDLKKTVDEEDRNLQQWRQQIEIEREYQLYM